MIACLIKQMCNIPSDLGVQPHRIYLLILNTNLRKDHRSLQFLRAVHLKSQSIAFII